MLRKPHSCYGSIGAQHPGSPAHPHHQQGRNAPKVVRRAGLLLEIQRAQTAALKGANSANCLSSLGSGESQEGEDPTSDGLGFTMTQDLSPHRCEGVLLQKQSTAKSRTKFPDQPLPSYSSYIGTVNLPLSPSSSRWASTTGGPMQENATLASLG